MSAKSKDVTRWRIRTKENLLKAFRSRCCVCGYDRYQGALEFHHLNPNEKDFSFGSVSSISWERLVAEVRKCVVLCSCCHKEFHAGLIDLPETIQKFDESLLTYVKYETVKRGPQSGIRTHEEVSFLD